MKKILEIRKVRQDRFYENRMKGKKSKDLVDAKKVLHDELHLVRPMEAQRRDVAEMEKLKVAVDAAQQDDVEM